MGDKVTTAEVFAVLERLTAVVVRGLTAASPVHLRNTLTASAKYFIACALKTQPTHPQHCVGWGARGLC